MGEGKTAQTWATVLVAILTGVAPAAAGKDFAATAPVRKGAWNI